MPEWGNPPRGMPGYPQLNKIGWVEGTRGTETSYYPQEKKSTRDSPSSGERTGKSLNLPYGGLQFFEVGRGL